jgi:DNA-binding transcriptional MerR regulator
VKSTNTTIRNTLPKSGSLRERASGRPLYIGELALRTGRSVHAIRWYEAQGLLPGVNRNASGRRSYQEIHVLWLDFMARLRLTGMSIAQMRVYASLAKRGRVTLEERKKLLVAHRAKVERTLDEWTLALELIDAKLDYYTEWLAGGEFRLDPRPRESGRHDVRPSAGSSFRGRFEGSLLGRAAMKSDDGSFLSPLEHP